MRTESPDCSTAFLRFLAFLQRAFFLRLCLRALAFAFAFALRFVVRRRVAGQRRAAFLRFFFAAVTEALRLALDLAFFFLAFLQRERALAERLFLRFLFDLAVLQRLRAAAFLCCTATVLP